MAGALVEGQPAGKTIRTYILRRFGSWRKRRGREIEQAYQLTADLVVVIAQLQSDLAEFQRRAELAVHELSDLEASFWAERRRGA